jgi:CheY-like chemotaxis protein
LLGERIRLVTTLTDTPSFVKTDPGQLEQILMNLAINARDAMPRGGTMRIETVNVMLDESYAGQHPDARCGPHVMLAFSDTGCGMDAATRARIFEPFFTTKQKGQGTGLGLSTIYGIVKQSGGSIYVYSEVGHGTTFKIYLPRIDIAASTASSVRQPETDSMPRGTEVVLLVEDDSGVRTFARMVLQQLGYTVLEVTNGEEALFFSDRYGGRIDLLLTDLVMPGESGPKVAERLRVARPDMKVLYISGYSHDTLVQYDMLERTTILVQKPFGSSLLAKKVREVLDGP